MIAQRPDERRTVAGLHGLEDVLVLGDGVARVEHAAVEIDAVDVHHVMEVVPCLDHEHVVGRFDEHRVEVVVGPDELLHVGVAGARAGRAHAAERGDETGHVLGADLRARHGMQFEQLPELDELAVLAARQQWGDAESLVDSRVSRPCEPHARAPSHGRDADPEPGRELVDAHRTAGGYVRS